ncbi:MAG: hypothetical protein ACO1TE_00635 [Prosthecobacter sp.]
MKKLIRLLIILFGLFVLCAAATPLVGAWWLRSYVNKERIVLETEKNINARVQLDDVVLTLFAWPPTLRLSGLKIGPPDQYVGTPPEARPPMKHAPVEIEMAYLELEPDGLWRREIYPRILRITGVEVQEVLSPQGSSLEKLFQKPTDGMLLAAGGVPRAIPISPDGTVPPTVVQETAEPVVNAVPHVDLPPDESPRAARLALQEISIEKAHFHITNQEAESRFDADISDLNLALTNIDIDPEDLERHNHLVVKLSSKVVVDGQAKLNGQMQNVRFADMTLAADGNVNPVDPATMQWNPAANLRASISRGSVLGGHMTIGEAAGQHLEKLQKYGVDLSAIRIGGELMQDLVAHVSFVNHGVKFLEDSHLVLPEYQVTVKRDSWMDFGKDQQGLLTRLYCGPALKEQIMRGVSARGLGDTISRMVVDGLSDDQGRISFDLTITGPLSHPEVKPDIQLRLESLLGNDVESKAKKLLENEKVGGFLKGLLKKL